MRSKFHIVPMIIVALSSIALLNGCSDDKTNNYSIDKGATNDIVSKPNPSGAGFDIGIGDIESSLRINLLLDESSFSNSVRHAEELTKMEWVARSSVDVAFPYPEKLNLLIMSRNITNFPGHAFRVTINLYEGDKIIHSYKYIAGATAIGDIKSHIVDVLPLLENMGGESSLLHVRGEIEFFPNTDEKSITEDSPAPSNVARATKMGNPMRITFIP